MARMIFVYTGRLSDDPKSGSAVRPIQMLKAFKDIGFEVTEISGYSSDRKKAIDSVKREIQRGVRFEFCYAETTTMPIALGDPGHIPMRPFLDLRFLNFLKQSRIPVFMFYRDCHWRFPTYGTRLGILRKAAALAFYKLEFRSLCGISERLYLPSLLMDQFLPPGDRRIDLLMPGCSLRPTRTNTEKDMLKLIYIGGVTLPIYDLSEILVTVADESYLRLTIICRESESAPIKARCKGMRNVQILHRSASKVMEEYGRSDIASLFLTPNVYFSMAMPIKLFEAVGYGVPVLARRGTAAGEFVEREGLGWVASSPQEAKALLRRVFDDPRELEAARIRVREAAGRHAWTERARKVARDAAEVRAS